MAIAVQTKQLTKKFGDKFAVDHLDLIVPEGEFFGFLGPNGAGKSTTIKMLVGLLRPTSGSAEIAGHDVWRDPMATKSLVGVLPEGMNLYERLKGREFVEFAGTMYGIPNKDVRTRAEELLDLLDLGDAAENMIVDYSQGMRKKVGLAAALIHAPRVLFLDEPFEGVDAISVRVIRNVLTQLRATGTTIFFSSHIMEVVQRLCTSLAVINNGQIVAQGTLDELRQRAETGDGTTAAEASLEEIFLKAIGAENQEEGSLSWLN